jgi:AraC-like DNA-binding protein
MRAPVCEFLSAGEVQPQRDWHMPSHSHRIHELIVVLSGRMTLKTPAETVPAEAGDLLFYRAGVPHEETSDPADPVNTFFVAFKADALLVARVALRTRDVDARVRQMVAWLLRDHRAGVAPERLHPLLAAVLGEVWRLGHSPRDPWLEEMRQHMQQNLARTIYLDDLARRGRMSKFAFVRKFKRLGGRTPMQELQLMRVNRARAMMLASGLPVKAIAPAVGLNDEYQLSKLFRRHFHLSPRELRTRSPRDRTTA